MTNTTAPAAKPLATVVFVIGSNEPRYLRPSFQGFGSQPLTRAQLRGALEYAVALRADELAAALDSGWSRASVDELRQRLARAEDDLGRLDTDFPRA